MNAEAGLPQRRGPAEDFARAGDIPGFKLGGLWRFFPSEVRAHLDRPRDPWAQSARSLGRKRYHGDGTYR